MSKISPILKWAGGKRQLLSEIIPLVPSSFNTYFEPFVGAGAVLLELQPQRAIVNDANTELIIVYEVIKDNPDELIALLREHEAMHCENYYYHVRAFDRDRDGDCGCELGCSFAQELISKSIGSIKKQINFFIILFSLYNTDKASQDTLSFCFILLFLEL